MARKLKTYQTSLGFFYLAIAAPSMKAALEAWGSNSNFSIRVSQRKLTIPRLSRRLCQNRGSFSDALSDQMGSSKNMPTCPHSCRVTKSMADQNAWPYRTAYRPRASRRGNRMKMPLVKLQKSRGCRILVITAAARLCRTDNRWSLLR